MIVISGALVLVALALLIAGLLFSGGLVLIYVSIGVSVVAALCLLVGVLQRRGEPIDAAPAAEFAGATDSRSTSADGRPAPTALIGAAQTSAPEPVADEADADEADGAAAEEGVLVDPADLPPGMVFVVAGRPRYHAEGCRYLAERDVEALDVADALDEGFSPCGVCKPDDVLAAAGIHAGRSGGSYDEADAPPRAEVEGDTGYSDESAYGPADYDEEAAYQPADDVPVAEVESEPAYQMDPYGEEPAYAQPAYGEEEPAYGDAAAQPRPTPVAGAPTGSPPASARTPPTPPVTPPAGVPATGATPPAAPPGLPAPAVSVGAAPELSADPAGPSAPVSRGDGPGARSRVIVIPSRGRYHRQGCRYVRGSSEAVEVSKALATRQGYEPCGVCRP